MGLAANRHTGFLPEVRAEAERIAHVKIRTMARVIEAGADLDEGGEAYWRGDLEGFGRCAHEALAKYEWACERLQQNIEDSFAFEVRHRESKKLQKAYALHLNEGAYRPEEFLTRDVNMSSRVITGLQALLARRDAIVEAASTGDLQTVYALISNLARQVTQDAAQAVAETIHDSRITHETSNIVELVWAGEGFVDDKSAHLQTEERAARA